jgi:signal transduction histidine kinase
LAIFGGAVSFAMLSAFWLIRERAKIGGENDKLRKSYSAMRADRDKLAALVEVDDQSIVVWDNQDQEPRVLGVLAGESGAPDQPEKFLTFGKWLDVNSAIALEKAVDELRSEARQFTININSQSGRCIEAQGRVSGGHAFVRFILLDGAREELAKINLAHSNLFKRFALLERFFEKLPSPVWIKSDDDKLAYVNTAYAHAVEASDTDSVILDNKALFDRAEREIISSALQTQKHLHQRLPVVVAGDRRSMEILSIATEDGSCGIAIDRSDVEDIRNTLKHAITSHEQTFDHLGAAIAIFDVNQKLQFHNSSFQQLWGLAQHDLEGQPSNSHMLDTLRDLNKLPEQTDWKRWKSQQLEIYHSTETRAEQWHLPDGRTLRVIVNPQNHGGASWVFENVTEELALKTNYNSLVRVQGETLDHLNEAVAVFGSNGKVRLTNPAFLNLWGFELPQDVEGQHIKNISEHIEQTLEKSEAWGTICLGITGVDDDKVDLTGRLELKSGIIYDYHLVYLPDGQSMLTLADMTAAVNIERALQERNEALEESDALKTRFIQHVSYELRAPLTSISGFAEILASNSPGPLTEKQSEYLDYISRSSDVLKALIDDILDLATIDAGAMQLDLKTVDFSQIVDMTLEDLAHQLERFQIKTKITISEDSKKIIGDGERIQQVLFKLLSNAVEVSPDGGTIEIQARRDGEMIEISVADQGPGIPAESRSTIFQRFETVQGAERKRGAGLGLSIVKSFMELHGGSVHVEDAGKKGARFVCRIPVEPQAVMQAAQ